MIEFTFAELFLFCWAILATGAAFYFRDKDRSHGMFVKVLIDNKEAREDFFQKMDEHIKENA